MGRRPAIQVMSEEMVDESKVHYTVTALIETVPRVLPLPTPFPNPAFDDFAMQNLIPPAGRSGITEADPICKSTQQNKNMTMYSPMLHTTASNKILLRY